MLINSCLHELRQGSGVSCPWIEEIRILYRFDHLAAITGQLSSPAYFDKGF
jgi:hypothetical protein